MNASAIIEELHELGVSVQLNGQKVQMKPGSLVPPDLLAQGRRNKSEIIKELRRYGDGRLPPLHRPPADETELRRCMDYTADPEKFAERFEWAMATFDSAELPGRTKENGVESA